MSKRLKEGQRPLSFMLSTIGVAAVCWWLFSAVLMEAYPEKSIYSGAHIKTENVSNVRVADFLLKEGNEVFLFAPNAPYALRAGIEFSTVGRFSAVVVPQYPPGYCTAAGIDQAILVVKGGSANERISLKNGERHEFFFRVSKGQKLEFKVVNKIDGSCGRAAVVFHQQNHRTIKMVIYGVLWATLLALGWAIGASSWIAFAGVLTNAILIKADATLGPLTSAGLEVNTGLALAFTGILFLFAGLPRRSNILSASMALLLFLSLLMPLAFITYHRVFGIAVDMEAIHGGLQSYGTQAVEFWREFIGIRRTLYMLLFLLSLFAITRQINRSRPRLLDSVALGTLLLVVAALVSQGRLHNNAMISLLNASSIVYLWELEAYQKIAERRTSETTEAKRDPDFQENITVVVVGESVNKKHMSAYGYVRPTTPLLDRRLEDGEAILYKQAYSNHTHSNPTMSLMLTQANQYNRKKWLESPSVFNFARSAGVDTHWLTNHRLLGGWSNHITTIINEADRLRTVNYRIGIGVESTAYDGDLLPLYRKAVNERPEQLTFLHLYNSHSQYCYRYPPDEAMFDGDLPESHFGNLMELKSASMQNYNCYDNTIHYSDKVLDALISELETKDRPTVLMYVADHAEEMIDARTHHSGKFTFDMINIPLFFWANDRWKQQHPDKWRHLQQNQNQIFTNDFLFETVLGLAGIEAPTVDLIHDLSSAAYRAPTTPLTLHGRAQIASPRNWNYWQRHNSDWAREQDIALVATSIQSIGQAKAALALDIRNLEVAVSSRSGTELSVVDEETGKEFLTVRDFLDALPASELEKVILRPADSNNGPAQLFETALSELNSSYDFSVVAVNDPDRPETNAVDLSASDFVARIEALTPKPTTLRIRTTSRYTDRIADWVL